MTDYIALMIAGAIGFIIARWGDNYTLENEHRKTWLMLMILMCLSALAAVLLVIKIIFGAL